MRSSSVERRIAIKNYAQSVGRLEPANASVGMDMMNGDTPEERTGSSSHHHLQVGGTSTSGYLGKYAHKTEQDLIVPRSRHLGSSPTLSSERGEESGTNSASLSYLHLDLHSHGVETEIPRR